MAALRAVPGGDFAGRLLRAALLTELAGITFVATLGAGPTVGVLVGFFLGLHLFGLLVVAAVHDILDNLAAPVAQALQDALPGRQAASQHQSHNQ